MNEECVKAYDEGGNLLGNYCYELLHPEGGYGVEQSPHNGVDFPLGIESFLEQPELSPVKQRLDDLTIYLEDHRLLIWILMVIFGYLAMLLAWKQYKKFTSTDDDTSYDVDEGVGCE